MIPLLHISEDVYKISTDWIGHRSSEALGSFVLWSFDSILTDLASHQGVVKGSKKVVHPSSPKSQVTIFVVLAMVLRPKPDVMISLLSILKESNKYQGQDKLPFTIWVITQASHGGHHQKFCFSTLGFRLMDFVFESTKFRYGCHTSNGALYFLLCNFFFQKMMFHNLAFDNDINEHKGEDIHFAIDFNCYKWISKQFFR